MDTKNIIDYLKTKSSGVTVQEIASALSQNEQELLDVLNSENEIFLSNDSGLWQLAPLYYKDFKLESSYIGMEVIHKALIPTLSMGKGIIVDASCGMLTIKFANKTASLPFPTSFKSMLTPVDDKIKEILIELKICPPSPDYSYLEFELNDDNTYSVVGLTKEVEVVTIPSKYNNRSVTAIEYDFLSECEKPKILKIPDSIIKMYSASCPSLESINVDINNKSYKSINGVLYSKDGERLIQYPPAKKDTIFTVKGVTEICDFAFYSESCDNRKKLEYLFISNGVRKIGVSALDFYGLKRVYIPETVSCINKEIFSSWYDDGGPYYTDAIVGGKSGSAIEAYCYQRNITFIPLKDDEIKAFFSASSQKLREMIEDREKNTTQFVAMDKDAGYQASFENGVLEISALRSVAFVGRTSSILPRFIREKVKEVVIGDNIESINEYAFDGSYCNLEKVHIGKDVQDIGPLAFFCLRHEGHSHEKFTCITVDEESQHFMSVDGVLYTHDMQTLVKYPSSKPEHYFEINCDIAPYAFAFADNLKCIRIGEGCKRVGRYAFYEVQQYLHAWFDKTVECFEEDTPFIISAKRGDARRWDDLVVGGYKDSYVHKQCEKMATYFLPIEGESEIQKFMTFPFAEGEFADVAYSSKTWLKDPYYRECQRLTLMTEYGYIYQLGEHGEEVILPEGAICTCDLNLKGVKRLVIPKTMNNLGLLDGPSPELEEIVVAEGNDHYKIIEGHLCSTDGTLLAYVPSATKQAGAFKVPNGTLSISTNAFKLLEKPMEVLHIPASVTRINSYSLQFYSLEIAPDNDSYTSIDGNLFSKDGKTLLRAKVYSDVFTVPDGTEVIASGSLYGSPEETIIVIPESVKKIQDSLRNKTIRTVSGSYAEQYAKERNHKVELI